MNPLLLVPLLLALGQQPSSNSGLGIIHHSQLTQPEAVDVPAIETEVEEWVPCPSYAGAECTNYLHQDGSMSLVKRAMVKHVYCKDTRRIKLQSEDGKWHCLYFGSQ